MTSPTPRSTQATRSTLLPFLLALFMASATVIAQEPVDTAYPPDVYIGAFGGASLVSYDASLAGNTIDSRSTAPGSFPFNAGDGSGFHGGVLFEAVLGPNVNLGLRIGYQTHSGTLTNQYLNSTDVRGRDGSAQIGTVEGSVETDMSHLALTPHARIAPFDFPLYFILGPTFMLPMGSSYSYTENILAPGDVVFRANGRTTRGIGARDFKNPAMGIALTANIGYEVQVGRNMGVFGELGVQSMINDYLADLKSGESWRSIGVHPTVGIRVGLGGGPPPIPPPPPDTIRPVDTGKVAARDSNFIAKGLTPSGLSDTLRIEKKRIQATEYHPLLPYIFFDTDSAVIPDRYVQLTQKTRRNFETERLPHGSSIDVYYNILNIVGQRMRDIRNVRIKLTGYISHHETDSTLPRRRAEAVRDYLINVWRIAERRIVVDTLHVGLPPNPSLSDVEGRVASLENQRVEIYSENNVVENLIALPDTSTLAPAGVIRFLPPAVTPDSLATGIWTLDVMFGDSLVKSAVTGVGAPPREIDFPVRPDINPRIGTISSTLIIEDSSYNEMARLSSSPVYIQNQGAFEAERRVEDGKFVDTYTLMLYSFDSSAIAGFAWRAKEVIQAGIRPNSEVTIIGHTDRIGKPAYNKDLSRRRAEFARSFLQLKEESVKKILALGEQDPLYDQDSPEGRYYSRTVTVIVETPATPEELELQSELQRQRKEVEAVARAQQEADEQGNAQTATEEKEKREARKPKAKAKPAIPLPTIRPSNP